MSILDKATQTLAIDRAVGMRVPLLASDQFGASLFNVSNVSISDIANSKVVNTVTYTTEGAGAVYQGAEKATNSFGIAETVSDMTYIKFANKLRVPMSKYEEYLASGVWQMTYANAQAEAILNMVNILDAFMIEGTSSGSASFYGRSGNKSGVFNDTSLLRHTAVGTVTYTSNIFNDINTAINNSVLAGGNPDKVAVGRADYLTLASTESSVSGITLLGMLHQMYPNTFFMPALFGTTTHAVVIDTASPNYKILMGKYPFIKNPLFPAEDRGAMWEDYEMVLGGFVFAQSGIFQKIVG
jgi:hypothetical protein